MEEAAAPVTLLIRSPSQKQQDQFVVADRGWSVRQLKGHLRGALPGGPLEQDQRLIYSGKLLTDDLLLDQVLPKNEPRHTIHLVCNSKSAPASQSVKPKEPKQQPTVFPSGQYLPAMSTTDGPRQRLLPQTSSSHNRQATEQHDQPAPPGFSSYSAYSPQQILWYQQLYARQYYMQCLAAAAVSAGSSTSRQAQEIPVVPAAPPPPEPLLHPFPVDNQPVNANVQPRVVPGANQNLRMNAQGGLAEEEEDVNRDWLDWIYTASRFSVFISILYFYSSLSRFMIVMGAMILMCLHHAGIFPFRQRPAQPVPNIPPQVAQDQNNNLQQEQLADEGPEVEAFPNDRASSDFQSPRFISTAWVFFKTFFASLIPEGPPGVVN